MIVQFMFTNDITGRVRVQGGLPILPVHTLQTPIIIAFYLVKRADQGGFGALGGKTGRECVNITGLAFPAMFGEG